MGSMIIRCGFGDHAMLIRRLAEDTRCALARQRCCDPLICEGVTLSEYLAGLLSSSNAHDRSLYIRRVVMF